MKYCWAWYNKNAHIQTKTIRLWRCLIIRLDNICRSYVHMAGWNGAACEKLLFMNNFDNSKRAARHFCENEQNSFADSDCFTYGLCICVWISRILRAHLMNVESFREDSEKFSDAQSIKRLRYALSFRILYTYYRHAHAHKLLQILFTWFFFSLDISTTLRVTVYVIIAKRFVRTWMFVWICVCNAKVGNARY